MLERDSEGEYYTLRPRRRWKDIRKDFDIK
jgi:hypothetical protein